MVNKRFSTPLGETKLKEKLGLDEIKPPGYIPGPQMANIQRAIVKACTALTQLAEILLITPSDTAGSDLGKLLTMNADALALLGHATHQLSMHR